MQSSKTTGLNQSNLDPTVNKYQSLDSLGSSPLSSARSSLELNPWDLPGVISRHQPTPSRDSEEFVSAPEEQPQVLNSPETASEGDSDAKLGSKFYSNSQTSTNYLATYTTLDLSTSSDSNMSLSTNAHHTSQRRNARNVLRDKASQSQIEATNSQFPHAAAAVRADPAARNAATATRAKSHGSPSSHKRSSRAREARASGRADDDPDISVNPAVSAPKKRKANDRDSHENSSQVVTEASTSLISPHASQTSTFAGNEPVSSQGIPNTSEAPKPATQPASSPRFSEDFLERLNTNEQRIRTQFAALNDELESNRQKQVQLAKEIQRLREEEKHRMKDIEKAKQDLAQFEELAKHAERVASLGQ